MKTTCFFVIVAVVMGAALPVMQSDRSSDFASYAAEPWSIKIISPKDGDEISIRPGESMPIRRTIKGEIAGFKNDQIEQFKLRVYVSIETDKWYPQGIGKVKADGTWSVQGWFGGSIHKIKAVLRDKDKNELAQTMATVTVLQ